ncbi:hypothetical protein FE810_09890 [Thalassotalea litorea]|uniref:CHASE3 domain-containing protein n=1 Tax=Thalassotalea litorea TaxID=2020715 RepID=A0A5R9INF3_9GAMM|nr:hypothetical protein [Thalassotalea litorea]TLU64766.1 hypothetical protein FE810_09890 [Thalassotalea litorea]
MNTKVTLKQQLRNNLIAIISIFIAISSLAYNTWRNEQTEYNRNIRTSSFEIIMSLAQLQLLVDYTYYDDVNKGDPLKGWSYVLYIRDLTSAMSRSSQHASNELFTVWQQNFQQIDSDKQSIEAVTKAIKKCREQVLAELKELK